ncbi:MAG: hypothetical protein H8E83_04675 [Planctomycetes bacterium]|nr:hypothetical protein [Planctomycetota bacterium]
MWSTLFTCFGTVVALVGAILLAVYVVIPVIGHVFLFFGRLVRFVFQELRDLVLIPIALFVGIIKLLRATLCVVLARWDLVHTEMKSAKLRFAEAYSRIVAVFIDNPLGVIGIKTSTPAFVQEFKIKPTSSPPNMFSGYSIVGTLPTGGSGAKLYVAKSTKHPVTVVIKNFDVSTGSQLPQIVRESRAMESAKKLGLVLEHHLDNERFWYAMPYHSGDHLGVVTNKLHGKSAKLSESQLQTILLYQHTLLQTLQEYHNAGLWHKDVKPDNIIIHDGCAHLVDLGLVTPLTSAMTLTTHGTEYFRDPELVRQAMRGVKVHQVDGSKFDVFGAGAVLYFMLENTFPAHGGLSDFSKECPESIRWVVRRAMADYDKRYTSIDEMLKDVEKILDAKNVYSVRPADLPSLGGNAPIEYHRKLPARTTPSTGGGPFKPQKYRTKPFGLVALLVSVAVGAAMLVNNNNPDIETIPSVVEIQTPSGMILVVNELSTSHNTTLRKMASNKIAELGVSGWELAVDPEKEARVRTWLPSDPSVTPIQQNKLDNENISGILLIQEGEETKPLIYFVNQHGAVALP